jgi:hypothetical protein
VIEKKKIAQESSNNKSKFSTNLAKFGTEKQWLLEPMIGFSQMKKA